MTLDATVVIPTHNRAKLLRVCLRCLLDQDYAPHGYEIVVVDDGSTDETADVIPRDDRVRYVRQPTTSGNGAAKNRGIREASGSVVIFTDSDAFAPPWFVREHVRSHLEHPGCIVDGPAITVRGDGAASRTRSPVVRMLAGLDFFGEEWVNVNASCPKDALIRAGGFDERFLKWQDLDLGRRLREMGLGRIRNRTAYVVHCEADRRSPEEMERHMRLNGEYAAKFYLRHPSAWARRKTRLRYIAYDRLMRNLGLTDPSPLPLRRLRLIHAYAQGLMRGFELAGGGQV